MRSGIKWICIFLASCAVSLKAQLLWRVENAKGETRMFLFGTMHLGVPGFLDEHPVLGQTLAMCDVLYTEVSQSTDSLLPVMMRHIFLPSGIKISDSLTEPELRRLDSLLALVNPALGATGTDMYKPMYLQLLIGSLTYKNLDSDSFQGAVDKQLSDYADFLGLEKRYLETQEQQIQYFFSDPPLSLQFAMLRKTLDTKADLDYSSDDFMKLKIIYLEQQLDSLGLFINELTAGGMEELQLIQGLLYDRNQRWVQMMIENDLHDVEQKRPFYAVGAGHLVGNSGVIALLKEQGYFVNPVELPRKKD